MSKLCHTLLSCAAMLLGAPATAAVLSIEDGILTGATGVEVNGRLYDVVFRDGTCASIYGTCTNDAFDFHTHDDAKAAGTALLDQVFRDVPAGNFDTDPMLTRGCETTVSGCRPMVAYDLLTGGSFYDSIGANNGRGMTYSYTNSRFPVGFSTASSTQYTFAKFNLSPVPEPATWAMMLVGLGMVGAASRHRRRSAEGVFA